MLPNSRMFATRNFPVSSTSLHLSHPLAQVLRSRRSSPGAVSHYTRTSCAADRSRVIPVIIIRRRKRVLWGVEDSDESPGAFSSWRPVSATLPLPLGLPLHPLHPLPSRFLALSISRDLLLLLSPLPLSANLLLQPPARLVRTREGRLLQ